MVFGVADPGSVRGAAKAGPFLRDAIESASSIATRRAITLWVVFLQAAVKIALEFWETHLQIFGLIERSTCFSKARIEAYGTGRSGRTAMSARMGRRLIPPPEKRSRAPVHWRENTSKY